MLRGEPEAYDFQLIPFGFAAAMLMRDLIFLKEFSHFVRNEVVIVWD